MKAETFMTGETEPARNNTIQCSYVVIKWLCNPITWSVSSGILPLAVG